MNFDLTREQQAYKERIERFAREVGAAGGVDRQDREHWRT
jgi:hypothetical protein